MNSILFCKNSFSEFPSTTIKTGKRAKSRSASREVEDQKFNLETYHVNVLPENNGINVNDNFSPFMNLVHSLLSQYPQNNQLSMQKKIVSDLYDGLMNKTGRNQ